MVELGQRTDQQAQSRDSQPLRRAHGGGPAAAVMTVAGLAIAAGSFYVAARNGLTLESIKAAIPFTLPSTR
jgi:hypothetical protein